MKYLYFFLVVCTVCLCPYMNASYAMSEKKAHMQIYEVTVAPMPNLAEVVKATEDLKQSIINLAKASGKDIHFYRYKNDTIVGYPTIILQCSDGFLDNVKMLPLHHQNRPFLEQRMSEIERIK